MQGNKPSGKKVPYKVKSSLRSYLTKYNRRADLPIQYNDLDRSIASVPLLDPSGNDTLWETLYYADRERVELNAHLCQIYALLKTDGNIEVIPHLEVARIDYCTFGNTKPYRIRIINKLNDNYDHFYIKKVDASRIYGLELEQLLSPNHVNYLVDKNSLIEDHIAGIPGDQFIANNLDTEAFNQTRIAKEFIKFNERCFVRLLGDMRSYNYIIDITPDIEGLQYRMRAIDFDQQSYEGRKSFYLPQYFKENNEIIELGINLLSSSTVVQYQLEERSLIANRVKASKGRLKEILRIMSKDQISSSQKVEKLKEELGRHHKTSDFKTCKNMGEIVITNINLLLQKEFKHNVF